MNKAERVRSYVQAQLAFVPFYGTVLLGPGDSLPEVFGLQTPVLTARNPLVTIQPESNSPPASVCFEGSRGSPTRANPPLAKKPCENQRKRPAEQRLGTKEQRRQSRPKRDNPAVPDLGSSSEPGKEQPPTKRSRRDKPRLPTSLSFLHGFVPKNVGPPRLTVSRLDTPLECWSADYLQMPVGDKGVFGKGKSSSTVAGISLHDLIGGFGSAWLSSSLISFVPSATRALR